MDRSMFWRLLAPFLVVATIVSGCSSGGDVTSIKTEAPVGVYRPAIDPSKFSDRITNRYVPLTPGKVYSYRGDGGARGETDVVTVTRARKTIMGVSCVVVYDVVRREGAIVEATYDWFAQDSGGNVWYFGEDSRAFRNGKLTSTEGSWQGGVDGAQPGIIMHAVPRPGPVYRQEYYPGHAEDLARVWRTGETITVPAGSYKDVLVTAEFSPLDPGVIELKYYAPGVGFVFGKSAKGENERFSLVRVSKS
jgi:hypothetical protein